METKMKVVISFFVIIFLGAFFLLTTKFITKTTGYGINEASEVALAQCLEVKGIVLYTGECGECLKQKKEFGVGYKFIETRNCDEFPDLCSGINIPAWRINNSLIEGFHSLRELSNISGC